MLVYVVNNETAIFTDPNTNRLLGHDMSTLQCYILHYAMPMYQISQLMLTEARFCWFCFWCCLCVHTYQRL